MLWVVVFKVAVYQMVVNFPFKTFVQALIGTHVCMHIGMCVESNHQTHEVAAVCTGHSMISTTWVSSLLPKASHQHGMPRTGVIGSTGLKANILVSVCSVECMFVFGFDVVLDMVA